MMGEVGKRCVVRGVYRKNLVGEGGKGGDGWGLGMEISW